MRGSIMANKIIGTKIDPIAYIIPQLGESSRELYLSSR